MIASNLMVGDLIQYNGEILRLYEFTHKYAYFGSGHPLNGISLDEIEPIPPTPKILEKNGFKKYNSYGTEKYSLNDKVSVNLYGADKWLLRVDVPYNFGTTYIIFRYLHELQHALKLCGIEKEIVA